MFLPALDLYLDPSGEVDRAFISHAHADHLGEKSAREVLGSRETLALLRARDRPRTGATELEWSKPVDCRLTAGTGTARLCVEPAGHILGAAQLVIDHPGGRFVYTGDYRTGAGRTHAAGAPILCDQLLVESTFALPIFAFPPRERTFAELVAFCRAALDEGRTPVVLGYALGKSQEIVHALLEASLPVIAHGAVFRMCEAFETLGVPLGVADGRLRPYSAETSAAHQGLKGVLVAPPNAQRMVRKVKRASVAFVSGWALIDAMIDQRRADAGFAISDHADHDDLVTTVLATGARDVAVTHGEAIALASILTDLGVHAEALETPALDEAPGDGA